MLNVPLLYPDCSPVTGVRKNGLNDTENPVVPPCTPISLTKLEIMKKERERSIKEVENTGGIYNINNNREKWGYMGVQSDVVDIEQSTMSTLSNGIDSPLQNLFLWPLLVVLWNLAIDYKFAWAAGFEKRMAICDVEWLRRAMILTFQKLTPEHQAWIQEEYNDFVEMDKICNWGEMIHGGDYCAEIEINAPWGEKILTRRYYRGWSKEEAYSKINLAQNEQFVQWV